MLTCRYGYVWPINVSLPSGLVAVLLPTKQEIQGQILVASVNGSGVKLIPNQSLLRIDPKQGSAEEEVIVY